MEWSEKTTVGHDPRVAWRIVDGEAMVVTPSTNELHTLDEVGTFIWRHLEQKTTVEEIVAAIVAEFDVDAETSGRDAREFLEQLHLKQLIVVNADSVVD